MDNPYVQCVNRQLLLASHQLDLLKEAASANERLRNQGYLEAALFHLYRAYLDMLRELAANYQLPNPEDIAGAEDLRRAMSEMGKTSAEVNEFEELQHKGFIRDLKDSWQHLFSGDYGQRKVDSAGAPNLISTRTVNSWELDYSSVEKWINRLREISERHRDVMIEY